MVTPAIVRWVVHEGIDARDAESLLSKKRGLLARARNRSVCFKESRFKKVKQDLLIFFSLFESIK